MIYDYSRVAKAGPPKLKQRTFQVLDSSGKPKGRGGSLESAVGSAAQEALRFGKPVKVRSEGEPNTLQAKTVTYTVSVNKH